MGSQHYDLVVIGAGPAGEKAAAQAAYFGKRVVLIEKESEPGGAAVHTGTLPSKTLREACLYLSGKRNRELYGVAVELSRGAALQTLMDRRGAISQSESERMRRNIENHGIEYLQGTAVFVDDHTVAIDDGVEISGDYVLVSTGSSPHHPDDIPFEKESIFDTSDILSIPTIPDSLTILGGGVIGCEYACMFAALGTKVSLVDVRQTIMPFLDYEIIGRLVDSMSNAGVHFYLGSPWHDVSAEDWKTRVCLEDGTALESDCLLFAAGRGGNTANLGLDKVGIDVDKRGLIPVNDEYRTAVPHIFAAGDVIGFPALASTSMEQGRVAACHAFGLEYKQSMSTVLPYGIYTIPEVSAVGETEESAREKGLEVVVGSALYANNARGMITGDHDGITKLVVEKGSRRLIGVHVIGERATELVHIGQTAMLSNATINLFIEMVFNFPTLAESYKYAAYDCLRQLD